MVSISSYDTRLPRVRGEVLLHVRDLFGVRASHIPTVVVGIQITVIEAIRLSYECAGSTEAARHAGSIDESYGFVLGMQTGHVVADFQREHLRPMELSQSQKRQWRRDALHD